MWEKRRRGQYVLFAFLLFIILECSSVLLCFAASGNTNHNPEFQRGKDLYVVEDSGQYSSTWATNITDNDNNKQSLIFIVKAANPELFSQQPAITDVGLLTFIPAKDQYGATSVSVTLKDDGNDKCVEGGKIAKCPGGCEPEDCRLSKTYTFTITIQGVNDCPTFSNLGDISADEDAGNVVKTNWAYVVHKGGLKEDIQQLSWEIVNNNNELFLTQPRLDFPETGATGANLRFESKKDAHGTATVTVKLKDNAGMGSGGCDTSQTATFVITILPINDAPSFIMSTHLVEVEEDSGKYIAANFASKITAGAEDEDGSQIETFKLVPLSETTTTKLFKTQPAIDEHGTLTFEPDANRNTLSTSATFYVQLNDNAGNGEGKSSCSPITACEQLRIIIQPLNDVPRFQAGTDVTVWEDLMQLSVPPAAGTQYTVSNWAKDITPGNTVEADDEGQTVEFLVTIDNKNIFKVNPAIDNRGTLTFTLAEHKNGIANVRAQIQDKGDPNTVEKGTIANFVIQVLSVNDVPSFNISYSSPHYISQSAGLQVYNDFLTDVKVGPSGAADEEAKQLLSWQVTGVPTSMFSIAPSIMKAGVTKARLSFQIKDGETGEVKFTIRLKDNGGVERKGVDSVEKVFVLQVDSKNTPPTFSLSGSEIKIIEDSQLSGFSQTAWVTSISPGTGASGEKEKLTQSVSFKLVVDNTQLFAKQPSIDSAGTLAFTPAKDAFGDSLVTVTAWDSDPALSSSSPTFYIRLLSKNDAPFFSIPSPAVTVDECRRSDSSSSSSATTFCAHSFSGWATKISSAGEGGLSNEADQLLTFSIAPSSLSSSSSFTIAQFDALFSSPVALDSKTGTLSFALKVDGGTLMTSGSTIAMMVTLRDNGGTLYEGSDSYSQSFQFVIIPFVPAPSFSFATTASLQLYEDAPITTFSSAILNVNPGQAVSDGKSISSVLSFQVDQTSTCNSKMFSAITPPSAALDSETTASIVLLPLPDAEGTCELSITLSNSQTGKSSSTLKKLIKIISVNDAPSFTLLQSDITLLEKSGTYNEKIVTDILAGPKEEASSQSVSFNVTCSAGTDNLPPSGFFSSLPTIDSSGMLKFAVHDTVFGKIHCGIVLTDNGGVSVVPAGKSQSVPTDTSLGIQYFTVTVQGVNRAPSFQKGNDVVVYEDDGFIRVAAWATHISTGNNVSTSSSSSSSTASRCCSQPQQLEFSVTCTVTSAYFSTSLLANEQAPKIDATMGDLTFSLGTDAHGMIQCKVILHDDGLSTSPHVSKSAPQTFLIYVQSVNDAPSFTITSGGTALVVFQDDLSYSQAYWATKMLPGPVDEVATQALHFECNVTTEGVITTSADQQQGSSSSKLFDVSPSISSVGTFTFRLKPHASGTATILACLLDDGGKRSEVTTLTSLRFPPSGGGQDHQGSDQRCQQVSISIVAINQNPVVGVSQLLVQVLEDEGNSASNTAVDSDGIIVSGFLSKLLAGSAQHEQQAQTIDRVTVTCLCSGGSHHEDNQYNGGRVGSDLRGYLFKTEPHVKLRALSTDAPQPMQQTTAPPSVVGDLYFTLNTNINGRCEACFATVYDSSGGSTISPAFDIRILPVNDPPTFQVSLLSAPSVISELVATLDVFETSEIVTFPKWAHSISPGPTLDERSTQTLQFQLNFIDESTTSSSSSTTMADFFTQLPRIDSSTGALSFALRAEKRPLFHSPFWFEVLLKDSGGVDFGGQDISHGLSGASAQKILLAIRVAASSGMLPTFTLGPDVVVLESSGTYSKPAWATNIQSNGAAGGNERLTFSIAPTSTASLILFSQQPTLVPATGELFFAVAANRFGKAHFNVQLLVSAINRSTSGIQKRTSLLQTFSIQIIGVNNAPSYKLVYTDIVVLEDTTMIWLLSLSAHAASNTSSPQSIPSTPSPPNSNLPDAKFQYAKDMSPGEYEGTQTLTFVISKLNTPTLLAAHNLAIDASTGYISRLITEPNANGVVSCVVQLRDNGGTENSGKDMSTPPTQLRLTIVPVNDPPLFHLGASQLTIPQGVKGITVSAPFHFLPPTSTNVGLALPILLKEFVSGIQVGPSVDEIKSQVISSLQVKCSSPSSYSNVFVQAPAITNYQASKGNADLTLTLQQDYVGTLYCNVSLKDSGDTKNGGINLSEKPFSIVVEATAKIPTFSLYSNFIDAAPNNIAVSYSNFVKTISLPASASSSVVPTMVASMMTSSTPHLFTVAPTVHIGATSSTGAQYQGTLSFTTGTTLGTCNLSLVVQFRSTSSGNNNVLMTHRSSPQFIWITVAPKISTVATPTTIGLGTSGVNSNAVGGVSKVIAEFTLDGNLDFFSPTEFLNLLVPVANSLLVQQGRLSVDLLKEIYKTDVQISSLRSGSVILEFYLAREGATSNQQSVLNLVTKDLIALFTRSPTIVAANLPYSLLSAKHSAASSGNVGNGGDSVGTPGAGTSSPGLLSSTNFLVVVAIVLGVLLLVLIIIVCVACIKSNKKKNKKAEDEKSTKTPPKNPVRVLSFPPSAHPKRSTGHQENDYYPQRRRPTEQGYYLPATDYEGGDFVDVLDEENIRPHSQQHVGYTQPSYAASYHHEGRQGYHQDKYYNEEYSPHGWDGFDEIDTDEQYWEEQQNLPARVDPPRQQSQQAYYHYQDHHNEVPTHSDIPPAENLERAGYNQPIPYGIPSEELQVVPVPPPQHPHLNGVNHSSTVNPPPHSTPSFFPQGQPANNSSISPIPESLMTTPGPTTVNDTTTGGQASIHNVPIDVHQYKEDERLQDVIPPSSSPVTTIIHPSKKLDAIDDNDDDEDFHTPTKTSLQQPPESSMVNGLQTPAIENNETAISSTTAPQQQEAKAPIHYTMQRREVSSTTPGSYKKTKPVVGQQQHKKSVVGFGSSTPSPRMQPTPSKVYRQKPNYV